jgi:membrane-associated phospholipid phosphatase
VNAHWASDVVAGAALGTLSGLRISIRSPIGR